MNEEGRASYRGRGVAIFLVVWGVGLTCASILSAVLGRFPGSATLLVWIIVLVGASFATACAIRRLRPRVAIASYCLWALALCGGFVAAVYEPGRPQDLLVYAYALAFVVALGVYLGRQLRG